MTRHDPYSTARKTQDAERVNKVLGRKSGGRVNDEGDTNIHIEVNATPKDEQEAEAGPMPTPAPPPPPMMPPPGLAPPAGGGGLGGGGGPIGLKHGGVAKRQTGGPMIRQRPQVAGSPAAAAANPRAAAAAANPAKAAIMKRARGGSTPDLGKRGKVDVGGAGGGTGRLEKAADARRGKR